MVDLPPRNVVRFLGQGGVQGTGGGAGRSLDWLDDHLAAHDLQLSNGDLVLAGTTLGLYPVHPGDAITVYLDHQPALQCSIAQ